MIENINCIGRNPYCNYILNFSLAEQRNVGVNYNYYFDKSVHENVTANEIKRCWSFPYMVLVIVQAQQKLNRTREATAKMKQIISEKLSQKRKNPLFPEARSAKHARYESHSDTDSGDDGAVVPKKLYDDLHQKYLALKKTTRELKEDVEKMRTREAKNTDILDVILEGVNSIKSKLESTGAGAYLFPSEA